MAKTLEEKLQAIVESTERDFLSGLKKYPKLWNVYGDYQRARSLLRGESPTGPGAFWNSTASLASPAKAPRKAAKGRTRRSAEQLKALADRALKALSGADNGLTSSELKKALGGVSMSAVDIAKHTGTKVKVRGRGLAARYSV